MEQNPLCIAFASQKGGVGKSTLTVLAASWLHYLHGIRVAVVDCDYPQHSILKLSNRDKAVVQSSAIYGRLLISLAENKGVKPYRILCCKPSEAMSEWRKWAAVAEERYDVVLFDLPGTVGNEGVLSTIVELDYLFIPMKADRKTPVARNAHEGRDLTVQPPVDIDALPRFGRSILQKPRRIVFRIRTPDARLRSRGFRLFRYFGVRRRSCRLRGPHQAAQVFFVELLPNRYFPTHGSEVSVRRRSPSSGGRNRTRRRKPGRAAAAYTGTPGRPLPEYPC